MNMSNVRSTSTPYCSTCTVLVLHTRTVWPYGQISNSYAHTFLYAINNYTSLLYNYLHGRTTRLPLTYPLGTQFPIWRKQTWRIRRFASSAAVGRFLRGSFTLSSRGCSFLENVIAATASAKATRRASTPRFLASTVSAISAASAASSTWKGIWCSLRLVLAWPWVWAPARQSLLLDGKNKAANDFIKLPYSDAGSTCSVYAF